MLCDPVDGSPPGSSVAGILQARILEWVAISFSNACMHAKSLQSCPTLCDPMDSSPPGSSVHRILQARILEWVAISFSLQGTHLNRKKCLFLTHPRVTVGHWPSQLRVSAECCVLCWTGLNQHGATAASSHWKFPPDFLFLLGHLSPVVLTALRPSFLERSLWTWGPLLTPLLLCWS